MNFLYQVPLQLRWCIVTLSGLNVLLHLLQGINLSRCCFQLNSANSDEVGADFREAASPVNWNLFFIHIN